MISAILDKIEFFLKDSANYLPLELSASLGGFVEEVIAPIPSPFVMAAVGSAAYAQNKDYVALIWLAFVGSVGKTLGAWIIYYVSDKLEDMVIGKFGRFLGVSHEEVQGIGSRLKGGWRDALTLFFLRAIPIVPSSPVSVGCGVIKVNFKMYMITTLLGNFVRNMIYIYFGYSGMSAAKSALHGMDSFESKVQILMFLAVVGFLGWVFFQRKKNVS